MSYLVEVLSAKYVNSVLQYGVQLEEMISKLEQKGEELAGNLENLQELEGKSNVKGDLQILLKCPMVSVLAAVKQSNAVLTGEVALPDFYPQIVKEYIEKHPNDAAILHPLCIAHQHIRKSFGQKHDLDIQQVACRGESGEVVYSVDGLKAAGLTQEQAYAEIGENACLFICKKKSV